MCTSVEAFINDNDTSSFTIVQLNKYMAAAPSGMSYIPLEYVFVFEAFINDTYALLFTIVQLKEYMAAAPSGKCYIPSECVFVLQMNVYLYCSVYTVYL